MKRANLSLLVAVIVAMAVAVPAIHATRTTPAPIQSKAVSDLNHTRLTALCGTWDVDMTLWLQPGGAGMATKGTSTIRPLFGGLFIEEKIEGALNGAPFTTMAWTGFNPESRQYEATRISSTNASRIVESGTFDEKTKQFELKADYVLSGDTWHQRTVIQPTSADAMIAASYLSFGAVPEWKGVEIRYTRRAE